jgi:GDP-4-dehydro-6-deoxy-D-mannose reductase
MRILVTGASGFVGRHLVGRLVSRGDHVIGIGTETAPAPGVAEWRRADLRAAGDLMAAIGESRPDAIVHLAAQSSSASSFQDPGGTFEINTLGTWHLLEAVAHVAPRARFLMAGTSEAYGPQPAGSRANEDTPFRPVSPYALSKAAADYACEVMHRRHDLDVIRTRSFGHSGPGQSPRFFLPSCARQVAEIEKGAAEPVLRVGDLSVVRDLCDVRDVVDAYLQLLEKGRPGAAYNVCRGSGVRLSELVDGLCSRARIRIRVEVDPARLRPIDVPYLVGDPSRIERETGWRARIPIERMLDDVLAEWRGPVTGT